MLRSSNEVFDAPSGDVTKCTRATPFVMPSPIAERLERAALLTLVHHCGLLAPAASAGAAELQAMMHSCGVEARAVRRHAQRLRNDAKNQLPSGASDEAFAKAGDWAVHCAPLLERCKFLLQQPPLLALPGTAGQSGSGWSALGGALPASGGGGGEKEELGAAPLLRKAHAAAAAAAEGAEGGGGASAVADAASALKEAGAPSAVALAKVQRFLRSTSDLEAVRLQVRQRALTQELVEAGLSGALQLLGAGAGESETEEKEAEQKEAEQGSDCSAEAQFVRGPSVLARQIGTVQMLNTHMRGDNAAQSAERLALLGEDDAALGAARGASAASGAAPVLLRLLVLTSLLQGARGSAAARFTRCSGAASS